MKSPYSQHPSLPRGRPTALLVGLLAAAALPAIRSPPDLLTALWMTGTLRAVMAWGRRSP